MLSLDEIVKRLKDVNHSEIARKTQLTRAYVNAIANSKRTNPRYETIKKLSAALGGDDE